MKTLQLLGDFVLQTPYRGSAPGPRWGTTVPQTPWPLPPNHQILATPLVLCRNMHWWTTCDDIVSVTECERHQTICQVLWQQFSDANKNLTLGQGPARPSRPSTRTRTGSLRWHCVCDRMWTTSNNMSSTVRTTITQIRACSRRLVRLCRQNHHHTQFPRRRYGRPQDVQH